MLSSLRIQNFRGFDDHLVPLKDLNIIVGRNNAGKSTIVEALTLVSMVVNRYKSSIYKDPPVWTGLHRAYRGIAPSLRGTEINLTSVFHRYGEPPAIITARFRTGHEVRIYIGDEGQLHGVILDPEGVPATTKGAAARFDVPTMSILPQVGPLLKEEVVLSPEYVRGAMSSSLAPHHFRNQINILYRDAYREFKSLAETSWEGLRVLELQGRGEIPGEHLSLIVKDGDFAAEVGWMGHGLQMWLQIMWFLARTGPETSTVILDEPDVYMHPDLQRKLIRLLKRRYPQTLVATHSIEIMAEVPPRNVLVINKAQNESRFATSVPSVQKVIDHIGGVHNIQLARLAHARRFLFVEGDDLEILQQFQNALLPESQDAFESIPHASLGGWSNWKQAVGLAQGLKNAAEQAVTTYCILDRDYHSEEEIGQVLAYAKKHEAQFHIWNRKEIENYLLVPTAIHRTLQLEAHTGQEVPSVQCIEKQLEVITDGMYDEVLTAIVTFHSSRDKTTAVKWALEYMQNNWSDRMNRLAIVSGKVVLSMLRDWSQREFGLSFTDLGVARVLVPSELPPEVHALVKAIEYGRRLL